MRLPILTFLLLVLSVLQAFAVDQSLSVDHALSGDSLALTDGRVVRLAGIKASSPAAAAALQKLTAQKTIIIHDQSYDRYGRLNVAAWVKPDDAPPQSVGLSMIKAGLAFVDLSSGVAAEIPEMLKAEDAARAAKTGIWADPSRADVVADQAKDHVGQFAFVVGRVIEVKRLKSKIYLNFGTNWRRDFSLLIAAHDNRVFDKAGIDPADYQGKNVRVRGWVVRDPGPMIMVTEPLQITILP